MGGRGSGSATSKGSAGGGMPSSPMAAKDFQQLSDYMQSKHGIALDPSVQKLDFKTVRSGLDGVEAVLREFPQMAGLVERVTFDSRTSAYAYASYRYSPNGLRVPEIAMSSFFGDPARLEASLKRDGSFHPKNSDARQVLAHEAGHALETALTNKMFNNPVDAIDARRKHKEATRIISAAARDVKKTPEGKLSNGKSKRIVDMIGEVSRYATTNRSEALAECVGDYIANGSNAKPLSRAVWKHLKREMG